VTVIEADPQRKNCHGTRQDTVKIVLHSRESLGQIIRVSVKQPLTTLHDPK